MQKNNLYAIVFKSMELSDVLRKVKNNEISIEDAERKLLITNFEQLSDIARIDVHRTKRIGIPEAVIADCKTCEEVVSIARVLLKNEGRAIITRVKDENYRALKSLAEEFGEKSGWKSGQELSSSVTLSQKPGKNWHYFSRHCRYSSGRGSKGDSGGDGLFCHFNIRCGRGRNPQVIPGINQTC